MEYNTKALFHQRIQKGLVRPIAIIFVHDVVIARLCVKKHIGINAGQAAAVPKSDACRCIIVAPLPPYPDAAASQLPQPQ